MKKLNGIFLNLNNIIVLESKQPVRFLCSIKNHRLTTVNRYVCHDTTRKWLLKFTRCILSLPYFFVNRRHIIFKNVLYKRRG